MKKFRRLILACLILMATPTVSFAKSATFAWDASVDTSIVTGYKFYVGSSTGNYTSNYDAGLNLSYTIDLPLLTHYLSVTAYSVDTESDFATELVIHGITATATTGGAISPASSFWETGSSPVFTITPAVGYRLADVKVNGVSVGKITSYTFTSLNKASTIEAFFVKKPGQPKNLRISNR